MSKFTDPRLAPLNKETGLIDSGMRAALAESLEPTEIAVSSYSVSAHIWVEAVLTDRALLIVKGAVRARVTRVPFPLTITRPPDGSRKSARLQLPLGQKTFWGSKTDPDCAKLVSATLSTDLASPDTAPSQERKTPEPPRESSEPGREAASAEPGSTSVGKEDETARPSWAEARRLAGPKPRRPRRRRVRRPWAGFAPPSSIWDMADNCVKCGRPLTDPRSRQARVGTKCIRIYGSQQRQIRNPAYTVWLEKKTRADVFYIEEKTRAAAEYARAKDAYDLAKAEWRRVRSGH